MRILRRQKGVTLIEIAIVLAIIAIAALFVIPPLGEWSKGFRLRQTAREISSNLKFAQIHTISSAWRYSITFNETVDGTMYSYVIFPDYDGDFILDNVDVGDLDNDGDQENETTDIFKKILMSARGISFDTGKGGGDGITFPNNGVGNPALMFNRRGFVQWADGSIGSQEIYIKNDKEGKSITISNTGLIRIGSYDL
jgi:prepilin-type N-terminal cleavage/methylation domain-containing protein